MIPAAHVLNLQVTLPRPNPSGGALTVASVSAARDQVTVSGTIAQIDSLMKTSTRSFTSNGVAFVANTAVPVVPVSLGITNIVGLNTLQRMSVPARTPSQGTCQAGNCTGSTTPARPRRRTCGRSTSSRRRGRGRARRSRSSAQAGPTT